MKYTKLFSLIFSIIGIGLFIIINLIQDKRLLDKGDIENEYIEL